MFEKIWRASLAPLMAAVTAIIISSIALLISDPPEEARLPGSSHENELKRQKVH